MDNKENIYLTLSYCGNESAEFARKLKRICQKIPSDKTTEHSLKKILTLRIIFFLLRKAADAEKKEKNIVYQIKCLDCKKGVDIVLITKRSAFHQTIKRTDYDEKMILLITIFFNIHPKYFSNKVQYPKKE